MVMVLAVHMEKQKIIILPLRVVFLLLTMFGIQVHYQEQVFRLHLVLRPLILLLQRLQPLVVPIQLQPL